MFVDLCVLGAQGVDGGLDRGVGFQEGMDVFGGRIMFACLHEAGLEKQESTLAMGRKPEAVYLAGAYEAEATRAEAVLYEIDLFEGRAGLQLQDLEEGQTTWFVKMRVVHPIAKF